MYYIISHHPKSNYIANYANRAFMKAPRASFSSSNVPLHYLPFTIQYAKHKNSHLQNITTDKVPQYNGHTARPTQALGFQMCRHSQHSLWAPKHKMLTTNASSISRACTQWEISGIWYKNAGKYLTSLFPALPRPDPQANWRTPFVPPKYKIFIQLHCIASNTPHHCNQQTPALHQKSCHSDSRNCPLQAIRSFRLPNWNQIASEPARHMCTHPTHNFIKIQRWWNRYNYHTKNRKLTKRQADSRVNLWPAKFHSFSVDKAVTQIILTLWTKHEMHIWHVNIRSARTSEQNTHKLSISFW